jgi:arogenate dehydrogenase (NADP+)
MKIGIIGLGLIGGSLGLDLISHGYQVVGVSRHQKTCDLALARKAVSQASLDFSILSSVELLFVCTPIGAITSTIKSVIPYLCENTIITDVGSVKQPIVEEVTRFYPNFIGGHPMAGTADQGIEASLPNLFQNAPYVLTPTESTKVEAIAKVREIIDILGSKLYFATPEQHDQAVALISHAPVMISAALIHTCSHNTEVLELAQNLASSGFRDTSRVGGGNPELGVMMAQYNRKAVLSALVQYQENLSQIIGYIEQENWSLLAELLGETQINRLSFLSGL